VEGIAYFGIAALLITVPVLVSASLSDWKEREVSDIHWLILGVTGLVLFTSYSLYENGFRWEYLCLALATVMILMDILWDKEWNPIIFYPIMALLFIVPLYSNIDDPLNRIWATIPVCYLIFMGMYVFGIVRGGADAKCIITLSIMFPLYPSFSGLPLIPVSGDAASDIFVPAISILFLAAIFSLTLVFYFMVVNIKNGDRGRHFLSGYRLPVDVAERSKVWPVEDVVEGEIVPARISNSDDELPEIYARLKEFGAEKVWVTPMIPFIIPLCAATVFILMIGNPIFLI
jgi:preflagellin peptidase FlaK